MAPHRGLSGVWKRHKTISWVLIPHRFHKVKKIGLPLLFTEGSDTAHGRRLNFFATASSSPDEKLRIYSAGGERYIFIHTPKPKHAPFMAFDRLHQTSFRDAQTPDPLKKFFRKPDTRKTFFRYPAWTRAEATSVKIPRILNIPYSAPFKR